MEQHLTTFAILSLCSFVTVIGGTFTVLWKVFSFFNQVKDKVDSIEFNSHRESIQSQLKDQDYLIKSLMHDVSEKVEKSQLDLFKKDIENALEKCASKKDLYLMKDELIKAIQNIPNNTKS
jgi:hypothetical protein